MRILFTIHQFFPKYYTGTELYLFNLAKMMQKFGHEVHVVTYMPQEEGNMILEKGVYVKKYFYEGLPVTAFRSNQVHVSMDFKNPIAKKYLKKLILDFKPDLIHVAHPMRLTFAMEIAIKEKIKFVVTLTDYWMICSKGILVRNNDEPCLSNNNGKLCSIHCYQEFPSSYFTQRMSDAKKYLKKADAVIVSAIFLKEIFKKNGFSLPTLNLIRHGFNYFLNYAPLEKKKKKNKKIFIFSALGSLVKHKGAHLLIKAFKNMDNPNARLHIYGEVQNASYGKLVFALAKSDKRISFHGRYSLADMHSIHEKTDVVVVTSMWYETYPLVGVAALAYAIPIIVPDMGGASELIKDGKNGYTFSIGQADSLTSALKKAIEDDLKFTQNIFYPYTIEEEAVKTQAIYQKITT